MTQTVPVALPLDLDHRESILETISKIGGPAVFCRECCRLAHDSKILYSSIPLNYLPAIQKLAPGMHLYMMIGLIGFGAELELDCIDDCLRQGFDRAVQLEMDVHSYSMVEARPTKRETTVAIERHATWEWVPQTEHLYARMALDAQKWPKAPFQTGSLVEDKCQHIYGMWLGSVIGVGGPVWCFERKGYF